MSQAPAPSALTSPRWALQYGSPLWSSAKILPVPKSMPLNGSFWLGPHVPRLRRYAITFPHPPVVANDGPAEARPPLPVPRIKGRVDAGGQPCGSTDGSYVSGFPVGNWRSEPEAPFLDS